MNVSKSTFIPAILWFLLVTILLCLPGKDIPQVGFLETIHFDKIVHMGLFGGLVLWSYLPLFFSDLFFETKRNKLLKIAIAALLYGIAMEFVQKYFIPGRSCDVTDMIADGAGAFLPYIFQKTMENVLGIFKKKQIA